MTRDEAIEMGARAVAAGGPPDAPTSFATKMVGALEALGVVKFEEPKRSAALDVLAGIPVCKVVPVAHGTALGWNAACNLMEAFLGERLRRGEGAASNAGIQWGQARHRAVGEAVINQIFWGLVGLPFPCHT